MTDDEALRDHALSRALQIAVPGEPSHVTLARARDYRVWCKDGTLPAPVLAPPSADAPARASVTGFNPVPADVWTAEHTRAAR